MFVCFFVSKITRKRLDQFAWNFQGRCGVTIGRPDLISGQFRETAWCRDAQHGGGVCCAFAPQLVFFCLLYYWHMYYCNCVCSLRTPVCPSVSSLFTYFIWTVLSEINDLNWFDLIYCSLCLAFSFLPGCFFFQFCKRFSHLQLLVRFATCSGAPDTALWHCYLLCSMDVWSGFHNETVFSPSSRTNLWLECKSHVSLSE